MISSETAIFYWKFRSKKPKTCTALVTMPQLFKTIQDLVSAERYVVGQHASERLEERGIMEWQVVDGLADGILLIERPNDLPNPAVEVEEVLPDGIEIKAVWSLLPQSQVAKLVTVHFFDENWT